MLCCSVKYEESGHLLTLLIICPPEPEMSAACRRSWILNFIYSFSFNFCDCDSSKYLSAIISIHRDVFYLIFLLHFQPFTIHSLHFFITFPLISLQSYVGSYAQCIVPKWTNLSNSVYHKELHFPSTFSILVVPKVKRQCLLIWGRRGNNLWDTSHNNIRLFAYSHSLVFIKKFRTFKINLI